MSKFNLAVTFLLLLMLGPFSLDKGHAESNSGGGSRPVPDRVALYLNANQAAEVGVDYIDHITYPG